MRVTLLGTGDTTGTPTVGCDCDTCAAARERGVSRSRFSVHVANERTGESLLVDFSPDFRSQFLDNDVPLPDAGIVTHIHFDHLDGLGNVYRLVDGLPVHAPSETDPATDESVAETIRSKYDYLEDRIGVHSRDPFDPFESCGFEVRFVPVDHPPLLCYGVVIEDPETGAKLSLTGDTSYDVPERSRDALADADLLLADAIVPASLCDHHPIGGRHEGPGRGPAHVRLETHDPGGRARACRRAGRGPHPPRPPRALLPARRSVRGAAGGGWGSVRAVTTLLSR